MERQGQVQGGILVAKIKGISRHRGEEGGQGDANANITGVAWKVKTRS